MRLIDAEWLKGEIRKTFPSFYMRVEINTLVNLAPSIDIVRCSECKYWMDDRRDEDDMGTCGLTHYFTNADDFCSYGCREEGADDETSD